LNRIDMGNVSIFVSPELSADRSWSGISPFRCMSAHSAGFDGCVPRGSVRNLPYGMGVPIPEGWACLPSCMVPEVVPDDFDAAMVRIAAHIGVAGQFFLCDVRTNDPSTPSLSVTAEICVSAGMLKYAGSLWLAHAVSSGNPAVSLVAGFRPLVVSGCLGWGTKAVYDGYVSAFRELGVECGGFEYDAVRKMFMPETALKMLLAECADRRNAYTHLVVIDGLSIPPWLLDSCGLKKILVSTEDPYSLDTTVSVHACYDYVMTNESVVAEGFGLTYLPTAADATRCARAVSRAGGRKEFDVCFIGAVFPERRDMLIAVHDMCMKSGLSMFAGGTCRDADLADLPFFVRGEFTTDEVLLAQASSKICLNMFRSPYSGESTKNTAYKMPAESMNPRCYDAPACGAALLTDYRPEVVSVFGDACIFDSSSVADLIYSLSKGESAKEMAAIQSKDVLKAHTYVHRSLVLLGASEKGIVSA
jgi:hypothetical protein